MKSSSAASALPPGLLAQLRRYAAGKLIYVPVEERVPQNAKRDAAIRKSRAVGASIAGLANKHSLSTSRIWEICAGLHPHRRPRRRA